MVVPDFWSLEVANVLAVAQRKAALSADKAGAFLELLRRLPTHVERYEPERVFSDVLPLATRHRLSAYDAVYLDLARRLRIPLATLDDALVVAARAEGVDLFK